MSNKLQHPALSSQKDELVHAVPNKFRTTSRMRTFNAAIQKQPRRITEKPYHCIIHENTKHSLPDTYVLPALYRKIVPPLPTKGPPSNSTTPNIDL